jgi:hypothetical protein
MTEITEREILLMKRRLNNKADLKEVQKFNDLLNDGEEIRVTASQAQKGFNWLFNLYKTPRGIQRKNNPFGYREEEALDAGLDYFTFDGFYDAGNQWVTWNTPIYTYYGKGESGSFQYYVAQGKINIIG